MKNFFDIFGNFKNWGFEEDQEIDWEKLKSTGRVTETIIDSGDYEVVTRIYKSDDGREEIKFIESRTKESTKKRRKLEEIQSKIEDAVKDENYELAASLKKEKDNLELKEK